MSTRTWCAVVVFSLMAAVGPDAAEAQSSGPIDPVTLERAELLAEYGQQLATLDSRYEKAFPYLREAADLRGADAEAVEALMDAGRYAYYAGRELIAVSALKRAGEVALETGDRRTAAKAFLDAAWVAHAEGEIETARALFQRGNRISQAQ